jgi:hypothetical protein
MSVVWLYFPAKDLPVPAADTTIVISLRHVVRIEFLTAPPTSPN